MKKNSAYRYFLWVLICRFAAQSGKTMKQCCWYREGWRRVVAMNVISATASSLTMQETSASAPSSAVWELGYADITKHSVQNYFKNMKIYIDVDKYVREHVFWRDEAAPIIPRRIWESMCVVRWLIGDLETLLDLFFQRESSPGVMYVCTNQGLLDM